MTNYIRTHVIHYIERYHLVSHRRVLSRPELRTEPIRVYRVDACVSQSLSDDAGEVMSLPEDRPSQLHRAYFERNDIRSVFILDKHAYAYYIYIRG